MVMDDAGIKSISNLFRKKCQNVGPNFPLIIFILAESMMIFVVVGRFIISNARHSKHLGY